MAQQKNMQINEVKLFLDVAEQGSLTKVAAQRNTVQSHISRQITAFEKNCGGALFRRTGRGVVLTEFGQSVAQHVRLWLNETELLITQINQTSQMPMGQVRLGILPSTAHPLMTHVFTKLKNEYPNIILNVREGQGGELDTMLETGAVDMAILFRHDKPSGLDETLLASASTYLVSSQASSHTTQASIPFNQLKDLPLVLPRSGSHWRSKLNETAKSKGFSLNVQLEADSLVLQKNCLENNPNLYALLGLFSIDAELRSGGLYATKIIQPDLQRHVTLALPKQGQTTQAHRVVADIIKETAKLWQGHLSPPV